MRTIPILNSREDVAKIDSTGVLDSIEQLGQQVAHVWELTQNLEIDPRYTRAKNVVVAGMGGSVLGTHVIQTLFKDQLQVPVTITPDYTLPNFVGSDTLVIGSSYSGGTEETLAATTQALKLGAKVAGITTGGKLAALLSEHNAPVLKFEPIHNPSGVARMALGYSIFGQMALFAKLGLIELDDQDLANILATIAQAQALHTIDSDQATNPAKALAFHLIDYIPILFAAEHLEGATHVFTNQLNENAKTYADYKIVPELNHHLLEGFQFPAEAGTLKFLTLHSQQYESQNTKRMSLTEELLQKYDRDVLPIHMKSETALEQVFELITLAAYTAFYLAILHDQDPGLNPEVDWLKSNL